MPTNNSLVNVKNQIKYPTPFFDIASTYTPQTMKEMFRWTRFFYYSSSLISPIIFKLSEYPVTGLIYDGQGKDTMEFLCEKSIGIKTKLVETNLDYNVFGNSFVSIFFPFRRFLQCPKCKNKKSIKKIKYQWKRMEFIAVCKEKGCTFAGPFKIIDEPVKIKREVRLIRWSPFNIEIDWNPVTDEHVYTYYLSGKVKKEIKKGNKLYIEGMPKLFLDAAKANKPIQLDNKNLYHRKRPNIADADMGWGMPVILPVLKDLFFLNVLRKGNEAVSLGHVVPWRIIYPSAGADGNPYANSDLGSWKSQVEREVKKWRRDPNHISIMPLPAGFQNFGGDGKMLMTHQEEKLVQQSIAAGVGMPLELLFGSMSWSGSNVSLRILENHFINTREGNDNFISDFLIPRLSSYFNINKTSVMQKDFKMADDIQFKNLIERLTTAGKVSTSDFLDELGYDYDEQLKKIEEEIDMEFEVMSKRVKYQTITQNMAQRLQVIAQKRMENEGLKFEGQGGEGQPAEGQPAEGQPPKDGQQPQAGDQGSANGADPGAGQGQGDVPPGGGSVDIPSLIIYWAGNIAKLPPGEQGRAIKRIAQTSPETAKAVEQEMKKLTKGIEQNDKPLPEQRPPRSKSSPI